MSQPTNDPRSVTQGRLDRHAVRRTGGVPTVSVLTGPVGAGRGAWSDWAARTGCLTCSARGHFPLARWLAAAAVTVPLSTLAVRALARRLDRDPDDLLAEWRSKTSTDRERCWDTAAPHADDDILRTLSLVPVDAPPEVAVDTLRPFGDRAVSPVVRVHPHAKWPGVVFVVESPDELSAVAVEASTWAGRVPALALAVIVSAAVWAEYQRTAPEDRGKALLREGEVTVAGIDPEEADRRLAAVGVSDSVRASLAAGNADEALVTAATEVARATIAPPESEEEDSRARSAAEAFLFRMLESLPETAGRFEPNAELEFRFGPRPAEVDLLCRELRLAVEIDGYYHFGEPSAYRRDRTKDWELQRRGFVVLRFLAADVLPRYEAVRDRILDAVRTLPPGGAE